MIEEPLATVKESGKLGKPPSRMLRVVVDVVRY